MKSKPPDELTAETVIKIGKAYGALRRERGITQREVSGKSGISIFTISTFESGALVGITMATYTKLLRAIGCDDLIDRLSSGYDDHVKKE